MKKLILGLLFVSQNAMSAATLVYDPEAVAQMLAVYNELKDHYKHLKEQTGLMGEQLDSIIGSNPFGDLHNSSADKQYRIWAPNSIQEFEDMLSEGFNPGDLADRYAYYQDKFPGRDPNQIDPKNPNSFNRDLYQYNEEWTKLNLASFAQTFDTVNASYEKINDLLAEVNNHQSLKESADFSNRLLGELAYLLQGMIQIKNFDLHVNTMLQQAEQHQIATHADFFTFRRK